MRPRWESGGLGHSVTSAAGRRSSFLGLWCCLREQFSEPTSPAGIPLLAERRGKSCSSGGAGGVSADWGTVAAIVPTAAVGPAQNALVRKPLSHGVVNVTLVEHCCHDDRTRDRPEVSGAGRGHIRGV